jgi:hypothetical protein
LSSGSYLSGIEKDQQACALVRLQDMRPAVDRSRNRGDEQNAELPQAHPGCQRHRRPDCDKDHCRAKIGLEKDQHCRNADQDQAGDDDAPGMWLPFIVRPVRRQCKNNQQFCRFGGLEGANAKVDPALGAGTDLTDNQYQPQQRHSAEVEWHNPGFEGMVVNGGEQCHRRAPNQEIDQVTRKVTLGQRVAQRGAIHHCRAKAEQYQHAEQKRKVVIAPGFDHMPRSTVHQRWYYTIALPHQQGNPDRRSAAKRAEHAGVVRYHRITLR